MAATHKKTHKILLLQLATPPSSIHAQNCVYFFDDLTVKRPLPLSVVMLRSRRSRLVIGAAVLCVLILGGYLVALWYNRDACSDEGSIQYLDSLVCVIVCAH